MGAAFLLIVGNIYPLMMWFEYDINMYKPRVSNYILNRLGWGFWQGKDFCIFIINQLP
jgi:hypothetical protein